MVNQQLKSPIEKLNRAWKRLVHLSTDKCPIKPTKFVFLVKYKLSVILESPHIFRYTYNLQAISKYSVNKILERLWSDSVCEGGITGDRFYEESYGGYRNESDSSDHDATHSGVAAARCFVFLSFCFVLFFISEFVYRLQAVSTFRRGPSHESKKI